MFSFLYTSLSIGTNYAMINLQAAWLLQKVFQSVPSTVTSQIHPHMLLLTTVTAP
jgi:hypothetical protein